MSLKIALDIDGVLLDIMTPYLELYNYEFSADVQHNDIKDFMFNKQLNITEKQMWDIFRDMDFTKARPYEETISRITDNLYDKYQEIDLITNADPKTLETRLDILSDWGFYWNQCINLDGRKHRKAEYVKDYLFLVDDNPKELEAWRNAGGFAIAFRQPWNAFWRGYSVTSLNEICCNDLIDKIKGWSQPYKEQRIEKVLKSLHTIEQQCAGIMHHLQQLRDEIHD